MLRNVLLLERVPLQERVLLLECVLVLGDDDSLRQEMLAMQRDLTAEMANKCQEEEEEEEEEARGVSANACSQVVQYTPTTGVRPQPAHSPHFVDTLLPRREEQTHGGGPLLRESERTIGLPDRIIGLPVATHDRPARWGWGTLSQARDPRRRGQQDEALIRPREPHDQNCRGREELPRLPDVHGCLEDSAHPPLPPHAGTARQWHAGANNSNNNRLNNSNIRGENNDPILIGFSEEEEDLFKAKANSSHNKRPMNAGARRHGRREGERGWGKIPRFTETRTKRRKREGESESLSGGEARILNPQRPSQTSVVSSSSKTVTKKGGRGGGARRVEQVMQGTGVVIQVFPWCFLPSQ